MKKYALVIPVHLAKINWLCFFLNSIDKNKLKDLNFDIVILTSNLQEQAKFLYSLEIIAKEYCPYIKVLNIDGYIENTLKNVEVLRNYRENKDRCIVNLKKFLALHWAMSQNYEYLAVCDCDVIFRDKDSVDNFFARCVENYQKNIYITATPPLDATYNTICDTMIKSSKFFPESDQVILQDLTNGFSTYPWFFDIPVYKKDDLLRFFSFMERNSPISFWISQSWHSYEHIIFLYWRLLNCNCKFKHIDDVLGKGIRTEFINTARLMQIYYAFNYLPVWMDFREFVINAGLQYPSREILMFFHTDRI